MFFGIKTQATVHRDISKAQHFEKRLKIFVNTFYEKSENISKPFLPACKMISALPRMLSSCQHNSQLLA